MASITIPSSLHWNELHVAKTNQAKCAEDVEAIRKACAAAHPDIKYLYSCRVCFPKVTARMVTRFRGGADHDQEWFAGRRAFLVSLEAQLAKVRDRKLRLESVEKSVDHEKEAWYRGVLRKHSEFVCATGNGVPAEELKKALEDTDRSRDDLVDMVWRSIGSTGDWESRIDTFMEKWAVAKTPAEQKALYVDAFLRDPATGELLDGSLPYKEAYEKQDTNDFHPIIERIMAAKKDEKAAEGKRAVHLGRLDELRRARKAFEVDKAAIKAQQRAAQATAVGDHLYDLPGCEVCRGEVQLKDVISCPVCQIICQIGGHRELTVYCSDECHEQGQGRHIEKEHECAAGDACVQEGLEDADAEVEDDGTGPVICKECLEKEKRATIFCTPQCASKNIGPHRAAKHEVADEQASDASEYVTPLQKVVEDTFKEINPGLTYTWS
jgi:hypothetical protein